MPASLSQRLINVLCTLQSIYCKLAPRWRESKKDKALSLAFDCAHLLHRPFGLSQHKCIRSTRGQTVFFVAPNWVSAPPRILVSLSLMTAAAFPAGFDFTLALPVSTGTTVVSAPAWPVCCRSLLSKFQRHPYVLHFLTLVSNTNSLMRIIHRLPSRHPCLALC